MGLQRPKGTQDILPGEINQWQWVESLARERFEKARYQEIRTPIFEATELFERGVGDTTDIVNKEMYTFAKGDRSLTLRPENTAGVVRAYIENGMSRWPKPVKLFYIGPMFRYERPQAGRQRQFHQLGVEQFGLDTPAADAEVILLAMDLFETLQLPELALEINNIGCLVCREDFKQGLKQVFAAHLTTLCETCQIRYETNPLRMLDCKEPSCKALYTQPELQTFLEKDHTCEPCQQHYQGVLTILSKLGVRYHQNKQLVRGLDYYTRTVFEITSTHLGAQNAVCGGGRYNQLVETLGGPPTPAVGWALGMERLIRLLPEQAESPLAFYIASMDAAKGLQLAKAVREKGHRAEVDLTGKALGKQIAQADKLKAQQVLILGESEILNNTVTLKNLSTGNQETVNLETFVASI